MSRLLRIDLPDDVWDRLNAEAHTNGQKIGAYLKGLILRRDAARLARLEKLVSEASDTGSTTTTQKEGSS